MSNIKVPKSKKELFLIIDSHFSNKERKELVKSKDLSDFHFALGTWIRNRFVYPIGNEVYSLLHPENKGVGLFVPVADVFSQEILEEYQKYLKKRKQTICLNSFSVELEI